jgi:hypothetical protein
MRFIGSMMRRLKAGCNSLFRRSRHQRRQRFRTATQGWREMLPALNRF